MRNLYISIVTLFCSCQFVFGQCPPPGFPDSGNTCSDAPVLCANLNGYCNTINNNNQQQNFPGCGGGWVLNNDEWFAFCAGTTSISIQVTPSNCNGSGGNNGLQGGVYSGCPPTSGNAMALQCPCTVNPFTLTSNNFVIGQTYWFVLDGCAGAVCNYAISVTNGSTICPDPPPPGPITGNPLVCAGTSFPYSVPVVNGATTYPWTLTPPSAGTITGSPTRNINIAWAANFSGTAVLCVGAGNTCYPAGTDTVCKTIIVRPRPTAVISGGGVLCAGSNGTVNLTITFTGVGPWTFTPIRNGTPQAPITTSDNPYTLTVNQPGTWTIGGLVMADPPSCPGTVSGSAVITTVTLTHSATTVAAVCTNSNGSVDLTVGGGTVPYAYNWSNGAITQDLANVPAGTYIVTVTDNNGCTVTHTATVANNNPNITLTSTNVAAICGQSNGSINLTVGSGGTPPYTFLWSGGETTEDLSMIPPGSYSVTVTDVNGCTGVHTVTVADNPINIVLSATTVPNTVCNSNNNGSINLSVSPSGTYTYVWSNGETTQDLSNQPPGSYSVTVTTGVNCTAVGNYTIADNPNNPNATFTTVQSTCDQTNGSINLTVTGGVTPYTFEWSNGATTEDLSNILAGGYSVTVTGANGCTAVANPTVNNNNPPINIASVIVASTTCNGNGNGSVNITVTPTGSYTFNWSNGATTEDISNLLPGTYDVIVTGQGSCTASGTFTVPNNPNNPTASISTVQSTCELSNGSVNLTVNGGVPPYTFEWSNGATTEDLSMLPAGSYMVTVTGANGCTVVASGTVINNNPPINITSTIVASTTCNGNGNGSINITVTPPGSYTYNWSNGATTEDITNLLPGTYDVTVTGQGACSTTGSFTVPDNPNLPNVTATTIQSTCDLPNGSINVSVNGGVAPYTYVWSNGSIAEDLTMILAGDYSITVTGANGCTRVLDITVPNNNPPINVTATIVANTVCNGMFNGSINVTVTPPGTYTYLWSNNETTQDISGLAPGDYTVTVTGQGSCSQVASFFVPENANVPNVVTSFVQTTCDLPNGSASITVSGSVPPYTFMWSNGATTQNQTGLLAGSYEVTVTGANGCSTVRTIDIPNFNPPINVSAVVVNNTTCLSGNGSINVTVTPPANYTYTWSNGATTQDIFNQGPGDYTVTISAGGTCVEIVTYTIQDLPNLPNLSFSSVDPTCGLSNGSINLTVSGGVTPYTYVWSNGVTSQDLNNLPADIYLVTVTGGNGCTSDNGVVLNDVQIPVNINGNVNDVTSCVTNNGSIMLQVTPANATVTWDNGSSGLVRNNLAVGSYSVTVSMGGTCTETVTFDVYENLEYPNLITDVTPGYCGISNGSIDLTVDGGITPYTYKWSSGPTTQDLSNLPQGTYTVTVTTARGCTAETTVFVPNNDVPISLNGVIYDNLSCIPPLNGFIDLLVDPDIYTYTYMWSNGRTTQNINGLAPGLYTVTVKLGTCTATETYEVLNAAVSPNLSVASLPAICGLPNGGANLSASGASSPYTYLWSNASTMEDLANVLPGTYTVTVTDFFACTATTSVIVTNNNVVLNITGALTQNTSCAGPNGAVNISVAPAGNYVYSWSNSAVTEDLTNVPAGTYTVTVTAGTSCSSTATFIVQNNTSDPVIAPVITASICTNPNGAIDIEVQGAITPYTYSWSNMATTQDLTGLLPGAYTVTVTGANGCTADTILFVPNDATTFSLAGTTVPLTNCTINNGAIDLTVTPVGPFTYLWSNGATTQDVSSLSNGIFTVEVTETGTCTASISFIVQDNRTFPSPSQSIVAELCDLVDGIIDLTVTGGTTPYVYAWSSGQTTQDLANLMNGTYSVTITGANNCTAIATAVIPDNSVSFAIAGTPVPNTSCVANNGAVNVTMNPTDPGFGLSYTYLWSNMATTEDLANLAPGQYQVTVSAGGTCTSTSVYNITNNTQAPAITELVTPAFCGQTSGTVNITVASGQAPFTYNWSNGNTTEDLTNVVSGTYTVTVTGALGCTNVKTFIIPENVIIPGVNGAITNNTSCVANNGGIVLNVTPALTYTYNWASGQTTATLQNLPGGSYTVTVSAGGTCTSVNTFVVPNTIPVVALSGTKTNVLCFGNSTGAINLTVNGGSTPYTYTWSSTAGNMEDLVNLVAGTYAVTVTDVNGCSSTTSFIITQPASSLQIVCAKVNDISTPTTIDGKATVNIAGGVAPYTVVWSPGSTQNNVVPGIFNLNNLDQGNYLVTVTDANGCTAVCSFNIGLVPCTTAVGTMGNAPISLCGTGCITADYTALGQILDPNDALQFILHEGSANQIVNEIARSTQPTFCFNPATMTYGTTYYIAAVAGNAGPTGNVILNAYCTVISAPTPIVFYQIPVASINNPIPLNCLVREVNLVGQSSLPGATFAWSTVGGTFIGSATTSTVKVGKAAPYTMIISLNGCKDTASVVVTDITNQPIATIAATPDDLLDCVLDQITLNGTVEGSFNANTVWLSGTNVYTPGTTLQIADPGTYQFILLDTLTFCADTAIIVINQDLTYPPLFINPPVLLTCLQTSATLVGGSPFPGINFNWARISGVDTTILGSGTSYTTTVPGTFWLFGVDPLNHCTNSMSVTVNANQVVPMADAGTSFSIKCFGETANLDGTLSTSVGAINFLWTTNNGNIISGSTTTTPLIGKPGTYLLLVTDPANGCTDTDNVVIDPIDPTAMATVNQPPCYGDKGSIIVNEVIGGVPPVKFSLNNGPFTIQSAFANLVPGPYTVVVQDAEGCSTSLSAVLIEPAEFIIVVSPGATIDLGGVYQVTTQVNLPLNQIQSVLWTPSTGLSCDTCLNFQAAPLVSTQYSVEVTTVAGCRDDGQLRILVDRRVDVYIPNVFTPNDDGENDIFTVFADQKGVRKINSLQVYSRWGELLWERFDFDPNDLSLGWDGTYRGKNLNPAVFVYQAEVEFIDGRRELFKGDVTIVR